MLLNTETFYSYGEYLHGVMIVLFTCDVAEIYAF